MGGELTGEVIIYSPPAPGQDDGLEIVTRGIRIEERKIWTPHDVAFRYGPNSGAGGDLAIVMHPPTKTHEKAASKSSVGRIKSFRLVRVDNINLQVPLGNLSLAGSPLPVLKKPALQETAPQETAPQETAPQEAASRKTVPVDIKCRGALHFDFDEYSLSLNDHVDVVSHNPDGPSDQLNCQELIVYFRKDQIAEDNTELPSAGAKPKRIVAFGLPVTLRADSMGGFARGEQLELDLETNRVWLRAPRGVELRTEKYQVSSSEVEYELGADGRLGRMWAAGPGRVTGRLGKENQPFEASWDKDVLLEDFEGGKWLRFTEKAHLVVEGSGEFSADQLHLFLTETPRPENPKRFTIQPTRMKALGNVRFDSPRLSGGLDEANIWFTNPASSASTRPPRNHPPLLSARGDEPVDRSRKLHVTAEKLNAELQLGDQPEVIRLAAAGRVHGESVDAASPDGVSLDCDSFQIEGGNTETPVATIVGQPARVGAQGAMIVGQTIQLFYGSNVVEIQGAGEMTLPRKKTPQQPWYLAWQRRMRFDGRVATFEGNSVARGVQLLDAGEQLHFNAQGESLSAELSRRIDFEKVDNEAEVGLQQLRFNGLCLIRSQVFDLQGARKSGEQMQVHNLTFSQATGKLHGDGPGWLTSVHNGSDLFKEGQFATTPKGLHYLRVDFERELVGNLQRRQVEFVGRVRSLYGPVAGWDETIQATRNSQLRKRDIVINSERLAVADMGQQRDRFDAVELEATGNAFVRGQTFTATGRRVSYAKAKDQLVLEGDGRNDAVLRFQQTPGSEPGTLNAGKILFWPDSKHFELDRFRSLDLRNVSQFGNRRGQ